MAVVEQRLRRDIAARRGDEQQDRNGRPFAAIGQRRQKVLSKASVAMAARARIVAHRGQHVAHAAMSMNMPGIDLQRRFESDARACVVLAKQKQQIARLTWPLGLVRMMPHGLGEQRARGFLDSRR